MKVSTNNRGVKCCQLNLLQTVIYVVVAAARRWVDSSVVFRAFRKQQNYCRQYNVIPLQLNYITLQKSFYIGVIFLLIYDGFENEVGRTSGEGGDAAGVGGVGDGQRQGLGEPAVKCLGGRGPLVSGWSAAVTNNYSE